MKRILIRSPVMALVLIAVLLLAGCTSGQPPTPVSKGDALSLQGEKEFQDNNLHAAARLFTLAQENYSAAGNTAAGLKVQDRAAKALISGQSIPLKCTAGSPLM